MATDIEKGYFVLVEEYSSKNKQYYHTYDDSIVMGDNVLVETMLGLELGRVISSIIKESEMDGLLTQNNILRKCSKSDLICFEENKEESKRAKGLFNKHVEDLKLDMTLVSCCFNLDKSKVLFTYVADSRIDFRNLLKNLSNDLKCRIELRQIGSRDRSKIIGGLGPCGLPLCCNTFLKEFDGISINMAKNQSLALNIQKISGPCGKLLCCLKYENNDYSKLNNKYPRPGTRINFQNQTYKIIDVNVLSGEVKIESADRETILTVNYDDIDKV